MTVTTSSPKTYTNLFARSGSDYSDQFIIAHYDLDPSLRGEDLDNAARAAQKIMNEANKDQDN